MPRTSVRRGRPTALSTLTTAALKQELERRQGALSELVQQRDAIEAEIRALGAETTTSFKTIDVRRGSTLKASDGRRMRNGQNLVASLQSLLNGKTMSVKELEVAVKKSGYRTKSGNFRVIVNQALIARPKVFKKVDRGLYTSK